MDILLIEDNLTITNALKYSFESNNISVCVCNDLDSARDKINASFKLVLLDISFPLGDGIDFYKECVVSYNIPCIFLTARDSEEDIIRGLSLGAVDYITKPFSSRVLLLKVSKYIKKDNVVSVKGISFDFNKMEVYESNKKIDLTSLEVKILALLFKNINKVVSRDYIINYIWDITGNDVNDNTVTVYLKRIRSKLNSDLIKTVKGVGYRIDE